MAESPREIVLQAWLVLLRGMTGVRFWGGTYPNAPTVELLHSIPTMQANKHPFLGVLEVSDSEVTEADHQHREDDDFSVDVYGQMAAMTDASPRQASGRLLYDCHATIRAATRASGALRVLSGVACHRIVFGRETRGYNDKVGDFILPCTARLTYTLAPR